MTDLYRGDGVCVAACAGVDGVALTRRNVLLAGGLAALPLLASVRSVADAGRAQPGLAGVGSVDAAQRIARGGVRRFNAPWLTPGARLELPDGVQALVVEGWYENRVRVAPAPLAWPHLPAADGTTVDASTVPEQGAPSLMAVLSGFKRGAYQLVHPNGKVDRVDWDARRLPYLWYWAEWGAAKHVPLMGAFYQLALEPFSRNPVG